MFPGEFNSYLTHKKIFSYIKYNKSKFLLKNWIEGTHQLMLIGWTDTIEALTDIAITLYHIGVPFLYARNRIYFAILTESNINKILVLDFLELQEDKTTNPVFLFLQAILLENRYIKDQNNIQIDFIPYSSIPSQSHLLIYLNYIVEEFYKEFVPSCFVLTN